MAGGQTCEMFISIKNIESTCEMVFLGFNNNNLRFKQDQGYLKWTV